MSKRLLLLSNSTNQGEGYLEYAKKNISSFLGKEIRNVAFVPYAGITISYIEYFNKVNEVFSGMGYQLKSTEDIKGAGEIINNAEAIVVGGGNTFHLLYKMYDRNIIDIIRKKVENGTPFIGWSAGSNIACPTIKTTNDMPVVYPPSFDALNLVPFQINPHYTDGRIPNHNGESREDRLKEFLEINPDITVVGLKEGTMLHIEDQTVKLIGNKTLKVFRHQMTTLEYNANSSLDFILK